MNDVDAARLHRCTVCSLYCVSRTCVRYSHISVCYVRTRMEVCAVCTCAMVLFYTIKTMAGTCTVSTSAVRDRTGPRSISSKKAVGPQTAIFAIPPAIDSWVGRLLERKLTVLQIETNNFANSVDPHEKAHKSRLVWSYTVCHLVLVLNGCPYLQQWTLHYENTPIQIYWKFYNQKRENFQIKIMIFFIYLLKT